tara:strand:+ start:5704 stop:7917 length:2214 start_codon:yes stop_codon:yes gene_type:complete
VRPVLLTLLVLVAWGLLGCSPAPNPPGLRVDEVGTRQRSALEDLRRPEVVRTLDPARAVVTAKTQAVVDGRLRLGGSGARSIEFAIDIDPSTFDSVILEVASASRDTVVVGLVRDGDVLHGTPSERIDEHAPERLVLTLQPENLVGGPIDAVRIAFTGQAEWNELGGVQLVRSTQAAHFDPGAHVATVGRETRQAIPLFAGHGRSLRLGASEDFRVTLSLGVPGGRPMPADARLVGDDLPDALRELDLGQLAPDAWTRIFECDADATFDVRLESATSTAAIALAWEEVELRPTPPRVLLITSDTHRGDYLGLAGDGVDVRTPAIDALIERGTIFTDCWATTHITNPSHVAIMTGVHPRDTGVLNNRTPLLPKALTLAEIFRDAGFLTMAAVSASHLAPERSGLHQGFDRYAAPHADESDSFDAPERMLRWLDDVPDDRPVFAWLHLFDAHAPYRPPADAFAGYWPEDIDPKRAELAVPRRVPGWAMGVRDLNYLEAQYRGEVTRVDQRLAPVLVHPAFANATIALTADHGEHLGVDDGWFDHRHLDRATLRVPMIFAGPDVPVGARIDGPYMNSDLGARLLEWSGVVAEQFPKGAGTFPLRPGPAFRVGEEFTRFGLARNGEAASGEFAGWLGVLHLCDEGVRPGDLSRRRHQFELFDLKADPEAATDVSEANPERSKELRAKIVEWLGDARPKDWGGSELSGAALEAELAGMGYSGADDAPESYDPACTCTECARW